MTASLYIHIPFCGAKCDYCNFFSYPEKSQSKIDEYLLFLYDDIKKQISLFNVDDVPSVYIGGGTPTILGAERLQKLFYFLQELPPFAPHYSKKEITLEANPESLDKEIIAVCEESGVTRLSCGIQTLNNKSRAAVGRIGSGESVLQKLNLLLNTKIDICFDLIAGLPYQTKDSIYFDIKKLLEFNPAHISLYELILEECTQLAKNIISKKIVLPPPEETEELWFYAANLLKQNDFEHYEVSAFARYGKRCLHNIRYWKMVSWLGAGTGASGTIIDDDAGTAVRTFNGQIEKIDSSILIKETIMMGFRCIDGIDKKLFTKRFKKPLSHYIPKTLKKWNTQTAYLQDRLLWANAISRDAFAEI